MNTVRHSDVTQGEENTCKKSNYDLRKRTCCRPGHRNLHFSTRPVRRDGRERDREQDLPSEFDSMGEFATGPVREGELQRMTAHGHDLGNHWAHRKPARAAHLLVEQRIFHPWADHDASGGKASLWI